MTTRDGRATLREMFALVRDSSLTPEEKTLWMLYRSYDTGDGAWPGDDLLAGHIGKSVRSVKAYKARLRELGYLHVELRGPNPAVHRATYPAKAVQPAAPQADERDADDCTASHAARCTPETEAVQEAVQEGMQKGVQPTAHTPTPPIKDEYGSTGIRDTPPSGDADAPSNWVAQAVEVWNEKMGGDFAHGRMGNALSSIAKKHGAAEVLRVLAGYLDKHLAEGRADFATPESLAQRFGVYQNGKGGRKGYQDPAAGIDYAAEAAKHHGGTP